MLCGDCSDALQSVRRECLDCFKVYSKEEGFDPNQHVELTPLLVFVIQHERYSEEWAYVLLEHESIQLLMSSGGPLLLCFDSFYDDRSSKKPAIAKAIIAKQPSVLEELVWVETFNPNHDVVKMTYLSYALLYSHVAMVEMVLQAKVIDVNKRCPGLESHYPLSVLFDSMICSFTIRRKVDLAKLLLMNGATPSKFVEHDELYMNIAVHHETSMNLWAAEHVNVWGELFWPLIQSVDASNPDAFKNPRCNLLKFMTNEWTVDMVKALLERGADPNNLRICSSLETAIILERCDLVSLLLPYSHYIPTSRVVDLSLMVTMDRAANPSNMIQLINMIQRERVVRYLLVTTAPGASTERLTPLSLPLREIWEKMFMMRELD